MRRSSAFWLVALMLGLGWAIRGHFGHEHGAAWAGAIGAIAILVAARRPDWSRRVPVLTALGAIGWAVGGMMSYGILVGYCRGTEFFNVWYGFFTLAVIGAGYGFIGGGLLGLGLETTTEKRPDWPRLLAEMVAGAWIFWGLLIYQFEWFMTPPRSELWAACLGISLALAWFLYRNKNFRALRVAGYAALGAGFGFAFGNFLQVMGGLTGIKINWWNVMEFTLGFFGGLGMIYAVLTREWPDSVTPAPKANFLALLFLLIGIPLTNIVQAFEMKNFIEQAKKIGGLDPGYFAWLQIWLGIILTFIFLILALILWRKQENQPEKLTQKYAPFFLFGYAILYTLFSHVVKASFFPGFRGQVEQYFYWLVIGVAAILTGVNYRRTQSTTFLPGPTESARRWTVILGIFVVILIGISLVAISTHGELPGSHQRFQF